jgi:fatty-acyl-CoA synthase
MAKADLPNLLCYEEPVAVENGSYEWRQVDAYTAPSLCYTSRRRQPQARAVLAALDVIHAFNRGFP